MHKKIFLLYVLLFVVELSWAQVKDPFYTFKTNNKNIYAIGFSAKGGVLAVGDGSMVKIFSTQDKSLLRQFVNDPSHKILTLDISKDSSLFVSGGTDSVIVIRDFKNGHIIKKLHYQKGVVTSVKFSPDGKFLATGGSDHKVYIYNLKQQKVIHVLTDHKKDITSIKYSSDGSLMATASGDKSIDVYDSDYRLKARLKGHKNWVRSICFSSEGTKLISVGDDRSVIFWNLTSTPHITGKAIYILYGWITSIDCRGKDIYVMGTFSGHIDLRSRIAQYSANIRKPVTHVKFVPNSGDMLKIVVASQGKGVMMMNAENMDIKIH